MVALHTTTTSIALKVWNNHLNEPSFCHSVPLLLGYLNFVAFYFFSISQKQNKKNNVD